MDILKNKTVLMAGGLVAIVIFVGVGYRLTSTTPDTTGVVNEGADMGSDELVGDEPDASAGDMDSAGVADTSSGDSGTVMPTAPPVTQPEPPPAPSPAPTPAPAGNVVVDISNFAFAPAELRILQGTTVVWTNQDMAGHNVKSDSGSELDSPMLSKGESYSHTFNTKGEFAYHCGPHPWMVAKVIVE